MACRRSPWVLIWLLIFSASAAAQHTVFLARHAERADTTTGGPAMMAADPSLSDVGRARAESLAGVLRDARITAIFVTEYKRTQETAAPLAKALGITPAIVAAKDTSALVAKLREVQGRALVIGHSNTVPQILEALGDAAAPVIADAEYDNLFILSAPGQLIQLRFK